MRYGRLCAHNAGWPQKVTTELLKHGRVDSTRPPWPNCPGGRRHKVQLESSRTKLFGQNFFGGCSESPRSSWLDGFCNRPRSPVCSASATVGRMSGQVDYDRESGKCAYEAYRNALENQSAPHEVLPNWDDLAKRSRKRGWLSPAL